MMENTLVFLLLLCSFSSAFVLTKDKSRPDDIQAVLQDMSAALVQYKEKIEELQTLSQDQAAKLKEIEKQTNEMDSMKTQLQEQAAQLKVLENQTGEVELMTAKLQGVQVAFSAALLASGYGTVGPYNVDVILLFKYVITNIGSAYNPNTGFFIAPVRGAYHFQYYNGALGTSVYGTAVVLVVNGQPTFTAHEQQTGGFGASANGLTLFLNVGDLVYLRLYQSYVIHDSSAHLSTFSGHLLFAL